MGQAKLRGRYEDRVAQAKNKIEALRPQSIICNQCNTGFSEFEVMDSRGLEGIDAVFAGICPKCKSTTFAYRGDPDAVAALMVAQQDVMGGGEFGIQKIGDTEKP
jgi:hypothetical protein